MKQRATRDLFAFWNELRGPRSAPDRAEIDPARLAPVLGNVFLLETTLAGMTRIRLAGTHLCAAFDAELRGRDFCELWRGEDRAAIRELVETVGEERAAAVLGAQCRDGVRDIGAAEMILLPLRRGRDRIEAMIGAFTRHAAGALPGRTLELGLDTRRLSWPSGRRPSSERRVPVLAHPDARRYGPLYVYDGGRF